MSQTKKLDLYIAGETMSLQTVAALGKIFSAGHHIAIDGKAYVVASADVSNDSRHSWKVSVQLEVRDE